MLVLVLILRHLSRFGVASREAVGIYLATFLWNVGLFGYLVIQWRSDPWNGTPRPWLGMSLLVLGGVVCYGIARRGTTADEWEPNAPPRSDGS